jgi:hypothetical protein
MISPPFDRRALISFCKKPDVNGIEPSNAAFPTASETRKARVKYLTPLDEKARFIVAAVLAHTLR